MAQAKTLTEQELKRLLDVTRGGSRYAERDVTMLLLTHWCGLRVGEVAALKIADVVDESGAVKSEIVLAAAVTKNLSANKRLAILPFLSILLTKKNDNLRRRKICQEKRPGKSRMPFGNWCNP